MTTKQVEVVAGVDTHADTHHVAVIDMVGRRLADEAFPATSAGYAALLAFVLSFGRLLRVGIEGTGSYGAGLNRFLQAHQVLTREVIRPNRQTRRLRGKTDPIDAYAAAATVLADEDQMPVPKTGIGNVEAIRALLIARRSAVKARSSAITQIKSLLVTAPPALREQTQSLRDDAMIAFLARRSPAADPVLAAIRQALRSLASRYQQLTKEADALETSLTALITHAAPALIAARGIGTITAAQLLVTAGDNPDRLRSEAAFAALCGTSPIPASSGKTTRHRLNRGGDRHANSALHQIALVLMSCDPETKTYIHRLRDSGKSSREAMRCLKRALARRVYQLLTNPVIPPAIDDLRPTRKARGLTQQQAATHFNTWPSRISDIERGTRRDDAFTERYRNWLNTA
jgi:transposase